jgi:hypothetical protein
MATDADAIAECPSCSAIVPLDATECPQCGELFAEEAIEVEPAPGPKEGKGRRRGLREKMLFYVGIILIVVGGPGIALFSWIHDALRIAIGEYTAFDAFGPVNRLVSAVGLIVLIVGIVFLILSLRLTRPPDPEYDIGAPRGT